MEKIQINNKTYEVANTLATEIEEMIKKEQKALEKRIVKQELEDLALEIIEKLKLEKIPTGTYKNSYKYIKEQ